MVPEELDSTMEGRYAEVNGIKLHYLSSGSGPLVILLHGFPEYAYSWKHQIKYLSSSFRAVAPDLRGYNLRSKPKKITSYKSEHYVNDIVALIKHLEYDKATIIGHDVGGAIAWQLARYHGNLVTKLAILNCPHPVHFRETIKSNKAIRRSFAYMAFFRIPWLPELLFKLQPYKRIQKIFNGLSDPSFNFSESALNNYKKALDQKGALTGAINYYRAMFNKSSSGTLSPEDPISCPTLVIWGANDPILKPFWLNGLEDFIKTGKLTKHLLKDCGHWTQNEKPKEVNELLTQFLKGS